MRNSNYQTFYKDAIQKKLDDIEKKQEMMKKLYELEREQQVKTGKRPATYEMM